MGSIAIYVPTLGRLERQRTWERLPPRVRQITRLVCPPNECAGHRRYGRAVLPCPVRGIQRVRQWILDNSSTDKVIMLDDDLWFFRRLHPDDWHLRYVTARDMDDLITKISTLLSSGYVHVGISARQGNQRYDFAPDPQTGQWVRRSDVGPCYTLLGRQCMAYGFLVPALRALDVQFRTELMSDFDITLQLLRRGYANPMLYEWCAGQPRSHAAGGCSAYRTATKLAQAAQYLAMEHRPFVSIVPRDSNWGEVKVRWDVKVSWVEAWATAACKHGDYADERFLQFVVRAQERHVAVKNLLGDTCVYRGRSALGKRQQILPTVLHEKLHSGRLRKTGFSLMAWQKSLEDTTVSYRWTSR